MLPSFSLSGKLFCAMFSFRTLCSKSAKIYELLLRIFVGVLSTGATLSVISFIC